MASLAPGASAARAEGGALVEAEPDSEEPDPEVEAEGAMTATVGHQAAAKIAGAVAGSWPWAHSARRWRPQAQECLLVEEDGPRLEGRQLVPLAPPPPARDEEETEGGFVANSVRFWRLYLSFVISFVLVGAGGLVLGFVIDWGAAAHEHRLPDMMEQFSRQGKRITSTCLYKQYNNGIWLFGQEALGIAPLNRNFDHDDRTASSDFSFYHHQGNLVEIVWPDNKTTQWLQITFNRKGLFWWLDTLPRIPSAIRYTKECYFWCGTVAGEHQNPSNFAKWLGRVGVEHYNGFLLNCLQFSERMWQHFEPRNQGCAPQSLVDRTLLYVEDSLDEGLQSALAKRRARDR